MNYFNSGPPYIYISSCCWIFSIVYSFSVSDYLCLTSREPWMHQYGFSPVPHQDHSWSQCTEGQGVSIEKVFWIRGRNDSCLKVLGMTDSIALAYFKFDWLKWSWLSHFKGMDGCKIKMESWRLWRNKNYTCPFRLSVDPGHRFVWQVSYVLNISLHFRRKTSTTTRH